jgi:hypothetical protein
MRHALNERNVESSREILQEILELRDDITAIIEREH